MTAAPCPPERALSLSLSLSLSVCLSLSLSISLLFWAAMQSRVRAVSHDSPLDGSTSRHGFDWHLSIAQQKNKKQKQNSSRFLPLQVWGARPESIASTRRGRTFRGTVRATSHVFLLRGRAPRRPGVIPSPGSHVKPRQPTDNTSRLSNPTARGGCVRLSLCARACVCVCACVKSLGISPSSRKAFQVHEAISHNPCRKRREMQVNYQNKRVEGWQRMALNVLIQSLLSVCCLLHTDCNADGTFMIWFVFFAACLIKFFTITRILPPSIFKSDKKLIRSFSPCK